MTSFEIVDVQPAPPKRRGRPHKKGIDEKLLERLAAIGCTQEEMATALGISVPTLRRRKLVRTAQKGAAKGRISLRRLQFRAAKNGNVTMMIWLGKQWLGQTDKQEISGPDGEPLMPMTDDDLRRELLSRLARVALARTARDADVGLEPEAARRLNP